MFTKLLHPKAATQPGKNVWDNHKLRISEEDETGVLNLGQ